MKKAAIKATAVEKKTYVLRTSINLEIFDKCKRLEKLRLGKQDKELVKLIKTQLKRDWSKPLMQKLNSLLKKYERSAK